MVVWVKRMTEPNDILLRSARLNGNEQNRRHLLRGRLGVEEWFPAPHTIRMVGWPDLCLSMIVYLQ